MNSPQVTTITFFRYQGFFDKCWGFQMMQFAHSPLQQVGGLSFYKLMGSGRGLGFNPLPDWGVYSLLQVWENQTAAEVFFNTHPLAKKYQHHTQEMWTLYMHNLSAVGTWSGGNPFEASSNKIKEDDTIAIITRATIKVRMLIPFWKYVPSSQKPLTHNEDLIYTKGIGEVPIVQMATFSLWKNLSSVKRFAYESKAHQEAIRKTRKLNWYSEELFARFRPFKSVGQWEGKNLLDQ